MAKKAKTESVRDREARLAAEATTAAAAAAARLAAERTEREAAAAAEAAREEAARRKAERLARPKRTRFVRPERAAVPPAANVAPLPPPSGTLAGRLLTKNVRPVPAAAAGPNRGPRVPVPRP